MTAMGHHRATTKNSKSKVVLGVQSDGGNLSVKAGRYLISL